jgi:hypothetical protein
VAEAIHRLGVFSGGARMVIYLSTYVGIFLDPLFSKIINIFDEHLQNQIKYDLNVSASPNITP